MGFDEEYRIVVSHRSVNGHQARIAIIGAGPAGLFAAEHLAVAGHAVTIYDRMPSPARKFLMAGRGGLNLTHSEPLDAFLSRYSGTAAPLVRNAIAAFPPTELIAWASGLGVETFTGTSGRVFPKAMKASPLLRAWLRRLSDLGVELRTGWRWRGFGTTPTALAFETPDGAVVIEADAVLLALGGASWPRLGSDGAWVTALEGAGVALTPLQPSNCGVTVPWSAHMAKHAGAPLKRIAITCGPHTQKGEVVVTAAGLEGGALYALSPHIRERLAAALASIEIDLRPDLDREDLVARLGTAHSKETLTNLLRKAAGLSPAHIAVLRERGPLSRDPTALALQIKGAAIPLSGLAPIERAISTAGGIDAQSLDETLMLKPLPGVFAAGEMLDFDGPTGGYLLQAAFATGALAARGIEARMARACPGRPEVSGTPQAP